MQLNTPRVELDEDSFFEVEERSATPMGTSVAGADTAREDPVGAIMDHSMEIESNERMRKENLHRWTLKFNDPEMEDKVCSTASCRFFFSLYLIYLVSAGSILLL